MFSHRIGTAEVARYMSFLYWPIMGAAQIRGAGVKSKCCLGPPHAGASQLVWIWVIRRRPVLEGKEHGRWTRHLLGGRTLSGPGPSAFSPGATVFYCACLLGNCCAYVSDVYVTVLALYVYYYTSMNGNFKV